MSGNNTSESFIIPASRFISNFFNPINSLCLYFISHSYLNYSLRTALSEFLPMLLILILPVILWISWNVRKGKYTNMDVSNRKQRHSLYLVVVAAAVCYLIINYLIDQQVDVVVLFLLLLLILMQISNFFIKSSMHTSLNVYTAALFFVLSPLAGAGWFIIAVLVGLTRVILKRHTAREVIMGSVLAAVVSFMYLYTHIQMQ